MEDIIDIIVTETTNTIEITSQASDELIDVNIIDNREDITLNVTPTLVEININSLTGNFGVEWGDITGTLADQTDLNTALGLKADLVGGKVPSSQLPSYVDDIVEVANYSALPATGETGKIYVVLDTNKIYRWSGSAYIEIADSTAVWGAITGTLSSQTDLQSALNAKFDDPTGDTTQYIAGDGSLITFPVAGQAGTLVREVRNTTGSTITKGTVVYISGAIGNKPTISKALATSDSTSAQTFGLAQADISNNSNGYVVCVGDLTGIDTSALTEGQQLYLSSTTAGAYTTTKQLAPAHLVYIGVVTRSHPTLGQIEVKIQNGYELDEIHDVAISSVANNDGLFYESSTSLWKNKSIATVLGYTPANGANYLPLTGGTLTGTLNGTNITITNSLIAKGGTFNGGASYGGIVTIDGLGSDLLMNRADTSNGSSITLLTNAVEKWNIGLRSAGTTDNFFIYNSNLTANSLTINSSNSAATFASSVTATSFVKTSGTSSQFLKADGSVDSSTYLTTGTASSTYLPLSGGTLTGALSGTSVSLSSSVTASALYVTGMTAGSGAIYHTASRLTFANYNASGTLHFEVNGGAGALTINADTSASFVSTISATGATLTGALNGTSASFSGNVVLGTTALSGGGAAQWITTNGTTYGGGLISSVSGVAKAYYYYDNGANAAVIQGVAGVGIQLLANNVPALTIASTGAATFSSSVTATQLITKSASGAAALFLKDGSGVDKWEIGHISNALYFYNYTAGNNSMYITSSGNVGIGTTSPGAKLEIASASFQDHLILNRTGVGLMHITATNPRGLAITDGTTQFMTIVQSSGNVGIGTTSPNGRLHIVNASGSGQPSLELEQQNSGSNILQWKGSAGTYLGVIQNNGNVGIGNTGESASRLYVTGSDSTSNYALTLRNSSGTELFQAKNNGFILLSVFTYNNTTTNLPNLFIDSSGGLYRSTTSSKRNKDNISLWTGSGLDTILALKPKTFNYKPEYYKYPEEEMLGLIAEEVAEVAPYLAEYENQDRTGQVTNVKYATIVVPLIKAIQELKSELDTLKNK